MSRQKPITEHICDMLRERSERGLAKYGTTIDRGDLSQAEWLQHLQEELLDAAQYVEAAKRQALQAPPAAVVQNREPRTGIASQCYDSAQLSTLPGWCRDLLAKAADALSEAPPAAEVLTRAYFHRFSEVEDDYTIYHTLDGVCEQCIPVLIVRDNATLAAAQGVKP